VWFIQRVKVAETYHESGGKSFNIHGGQKSEDLMFLNKFSDENVCCVTFECDM